MMKNPSRIYREWKRRTTLGLILASGLISGEVFADPALSFVVRDNSTAQTLSETYLNNPDDWEKVIEYNTVIKPTRIIEVPSRLLKMDGKAFFSEVCCRDKVRVKLTGTEIWIFALPGLIIEKGDLIATGLNAGAEITMSNGDRAVIRQLTTLVFDPYIDSEQKQINLFKLFQGKLISLINKQKSRDVRYEIQTPTAISLVRGTRFRTKVSDTGETKFEVLQGEIELEAVGEEITVRENFGVKIPAPLREEE